MINVTRKKSCKQDKYQQNFLSYLRVIELEHNDALLSKAEKMHQGNHNDRKEAKW